MSVVAWQTVGIGISKLGSMKKKTLTPRQAHFSRCLAGGASQADAYREAYQPGSSTTAASIHTLASRVAGKVEVRSRVDALIKARERAVVQSAEIERRLSSLLHSDDDAESLDHTKPSDLLN